MVDKEQETQPAEKDKPKDQKATNPVNTIQAVLSTGSTAAQANLLLELTEHLAEGKNVQQVVSDVCRLLIAPAKASAVVKRLAYDAVEVSSLHHNDWMYVCQGLLQDLSAEQPLEIQIRVLEVIAMLPEIHVTRMMSDTDLESKLLVFVNGATPETQGAAAVAVAHCYCQPAFAVPLFSDPERLCRTMASWEHIADLATDAVPRVVHGGLVAVNNTIAAFSAARSARESEQTGELQTVLALMAWAGAVRVRVAGAHVLYRMDAMPASLKVDSINMLITILDLLMTQDPHPRLDAYGHLISSGTAKPAATGTSANAAAPVSDGWLFTAVGAFCLEHISSPDTALATEASRALLHLKWLHSIVKFPRLQVAPCPDDWARSAMSALIRVGEPLDAIAAREAATATICRYLCVLPSSDVPAVGKTVVHWVVQRASGSARVANFLLLWRAIIDTDLSVWRRAQAEQLLPESLVAPIPAGRAHAHALIELLEVPLLKMLRAGDVLEASPTINQEIVATLMEVLLTHEEANRAIEHALKSHDQIQAQEGEADDLKVCIDSAAVLDSRLTAVEWTQIALVALQGTQGCLGWDHKREKKQGTYPATLTSDKWFVLASRTQHVLNTLRKCEDLSSAEHLQPNADSPRLQQGRMRLVQKLNDATNTLQGMFLKVLKFWRSLSPASTPRALWAIVHHLSLPAVLEEQWAELLDMLRELLLYQPLSTTEMHTQELEMSTRTGALPYSVGAQGFKARDRPLLFGGHLLHMPEATDWWDACDEGLAMAALALERVCYLCYNNFAEYSHLAGFQELSQSIAAMLSQAFTSLPEAVGLQELCERLNEVMQAVVENLPGQAEELEEDVVYQSADAHSASLPPSEQLHPEQAATGSRVTDAASMAPGRISPVVRSASPATTEQAAKRLETIGEEPVGGSKRRLFGLRRKTGSGAGSQDPNKDPPETNEASGRPDAVEAHDAKDPKAATAARAAPKGHAAASFPAADGSASGAKGIDGAADASSGTAVPKIRNSNVLVSGAKGMGNVLGLRKKKAPTAPIQSVHDMHAHHSKAADAAPAGAAAATPGGAPSPHRPAPPQPPSNGAAVNSAATTVAAASADGVAATGRRHVFVAPTRITAAPAPPSTSGNVSSTSSITGTSLPPAVVEARRVAAGRPPQVARVYIGPMLEPLQPLFTHAQEGFPFGAPVAITLADSVRAKRHIVFESQLTSSQQQIWEAYRDPSVRPDTSNTLADLLATIGTMPAPMQIARSLDPASVLNGAGACILAVPNRFVELTSGHEALRLFARVCMDWAAMHMVLTLKAQSMLEQDLQGVLVKVQIQGAAVFVGLSGWTIPRLEPLESTTHTLTFAVSGSGAVVLQPIVSHKMLLGGTQSLERLEVHTAPLRVPITLQLKAPRVHLSPEIFFQRFHTWHYTCTVSGTCKWPGAAGGLAVLDIIEKKPFLRVHLDLLPALGGFQAAYLAYDTTNRAVGLLISAQLILSDPEMSPLTCDAAVMASLSRCMFRIVAHTASSGAAASMRSDPANWLRELTDGAVAMSVAGGDHVAAGQVPLLSNKYAHAAVQFKKELTPDPEVEAAEMAKAAGSESAANSGAKKEATAHGDGVADSGGAAKLAAFAKAAAAAAAAGTQTDEPTVETSDDEFQVEEQPEFKAVLEQVGDDWLHVAVLSQWQQMRDSMVAA